jgi:hypothetical protein
VRTRITNPRRAPTPAESVEPIEVPVFREVPQRRNDYDTVVALEQAAQQQQ